MTGPDDLHTLNRIYAQFSFARDNHDHDGWLSLFTDDGVFDIDSGVYRGQQSLRQFSESLETNLQGSGVKIKHFVSDVDVTITREEAEGKAYFQFFTIEAGIPKLGALGTYRDRFRFADGYWKISERIVRNDTGLDVPR